MWRRRYNDEGELLFMGLLEASRKPGCTFQDTHTAHPHRPPRAVKRNAARSRQPAGLPRPRRGDKPKVSKSSGRALKAVSKNSEEVYVPDSTSKDAMAAPCSQPTALTRGSHVSRGHRAAAAPSTHSSSDSTALPDTQRQHKMVRPTSRPRRNPKSAAKTQQAVEGVESSPLLPQRNITFDCYDRSLGIWLDDAPAPTEGVIVREVSRGLASGRLVPGDVILEVNGMSVIGMPVRGGIDRLIVTGKPLTLTVKTPQSARDRFREAPRTSLYPLSPHRKVKGTCHDSATPTSDSDQNDQTGNDGQHSDFSHDSGEAPDSKQADLLRLCVDAKVPKQNRYASSLPALRLIEPNSQVFDDAIWRKRENAVEKTLETIRVSVAAAKRRVGLPLNPGHVSATATAWQMPQEENDSDALHTGAQCSGYDSEEEFALHPAYQTSFDTGDVGDDHNVPLEEMYLLSSTQDCTVGGDTLASSIDMRLISGQISSSLIGDDMRSAVDTSGASFRGFDMRQTYT